MGATLTYLPHIKGMIHMMTNVRRQFLLVYEITVYTFLKEKMFCDQVELIKLKQENNNNQNNNNNMQRFCLSSL